ncbi:hypothetical protein RJ641_017069 [Dillenia turbinata]|uniref:Uncharacterized protein n=1 Tax=Dillenia turbinata TaxID=194707 RepID=A0AAN8YZE6_9MAGN
MGLVLSAALGAVGAPLTPTKALVDVLVDKIYKQYEEKDGLKDFEGFHCAILDIYSFFGNKEEINRDHKAMIFTGLVTPPAAVYTKKALENQSKLQALKYVPDIVFVPVSTATCLISVKLLARAMLGLIIFEIQFLLLVHAPGFGMGMDSFLYWSKKPFPILISFPHPFPHECPLS